MKKLLKVTIGAALALTLTASTAMAGECPPQEPPPPPGCDAPFQGWEGNVRVGGPVFSGGEIYSVSVTQTPSNCVRIKTHFFKRVARQFIRFDTVAPVADPNVWEVVVLS